MVFQAFSAVLKNSVTPVPPDFEVGGTDAGGTWKPTAIGPLLTVREAADRLRVKPVTIYRMCARGELPHVRVSNAIRIREADFFTIARYAKNGIMNRHP